MRVRKLQDAQDPSLAKRRPATNVLVYDAIKDHMDAALTRSRRCVLLDLLLSNNLNSESFYSGIDSNEDAVDIIANTFLAGVTSEQLLKIALGFLQHRECMLCNNFTERIKYLTQVSSVCIAVFGHLAWTCQMASGNRGDDFRSL